MDLDMRVLPTNRGNHRTRKGSLPERHEGAVDTHERRVILRPDLFLDAAYIIASAGRRSGAYPIFLR